MKTVLIIVGVLFVVLLVAGAGVYGYTVYEGGICDESSKAYVDQSVPAIVSNWNPDELFKRESPALREASSDDQLTASFTKLSGLGQMQSYDGSQGNARVHLSKTGKFLITAIYSAQATFEKGKINVDLNLIQIDGAWRIQGFGIHPHH